MLMLTLLDRSLRLIQVYTPNSSALYPQFVEILIPYEGIKLTDPFGRVQCTRWDDAVVWKVVIGQHGNADC